MFIKKKITYLTFYLNNFFPCSYTQKKAKVQKNDETILKIILKFIYFNYINYITVKLTIKITTKNIVYFLLFCLLFLSKAEIYIYIQKEKMLFWNILLNNLKINPFLCIYL
jgi:hypothetical protein